MCHGELKMDFGERVSFIVGQNGSGKSAILNSLQVRYLLYRLCYRSISQTSYLRYLIFLKRILMEDTELTCSLESGLSLKPICSIRIPSRKSR